MGKTRIQKGRRFLEQRVGVALRCATQGEMMHKETQEAFRKNELKGT